MVLLSCKRELLDDGGWSLVGIGFRAQECKGNNWLRSSQSGHQEHDRSARNMRGPLLLTPQTLHASSKRPQAQNPSSEEKQRKMLAAVDVNQAGG